jgi:hypothetical protein
MATTLPNSFISIAVSWRLWAGVRAWQSALMIASEGSPCSAGAIAVDLRLLVSLLLDFDVHDPVVRAVIPLNAVLVDERKGHHAVWNVRGAEMQNEGKDYVVHFVSFCSGGQTATRSS